MKKEPLITVGTITAIVAAFLVFLQEFGVPISEGQQDAIRNLVAVLAPVILALIGRQFVFAPATVENLQERDVIRDVSDGGPPAGPAPERTTPNSGVMHYQPTGLGYVTPYLKPSDPVARRTNPGGR